MERGEWSEAGTQYREKEGQMHIVHPVFDLGSWTVAGKSAYPHRAYYDETAGVFYLLCDQMLRVMVCKKEVKVVKFVPHVVDFMVDRDDGMQFIVQTHKKGKPVQGFQLYNLRTNTISNYSLSTKGKLIGLMFDVMSTDTKIFV